MIGAAKLMRKDEPGTERFLDYFYKGCAKTLFAPITDLPDWRSLNGAFIPSYLMLHTSSQAVQVSFL